MPFCDFKISQIVEDAGAVKVLARFYEGEETVIDGKTVYERTAPVGERTFIFPARTSQARIEKAIADRLADFSAREPIAAQKAIRDARP